MVLIRKASGEYEEFDETKLNASLMRVGATPEMAKDIIAFTKSKIYKGITTKKIYMIALKRLRKADIPTSCMYKLKWAVMRLGEHGYPFEHFIGKLFEKMGYRIELNRIKKGICIEHEIDVGAFKGEEKIFMECKHKSKAGTVIDIQTALYVYARFLDLKNDYNKGKLITNSKMSPQAIEYGKCIGLELLAWGYPEGAGLEKYLEKYKVFPVTVLHTLKKEDVTKCLSHSIVTITELAELDAMKIASMLDRDIKKAELVLWEAKKVIEGRVSPSPN